MTPRPLLAPLLALLALTAACGWRAGLPRPADAETLAVAFPGNDTRLRDLEVDLAQALAEAAIDRVSLRLTEPDRADLVIRGTVVDFSRPGGVRSPQNELLEIRPEIRLRLELVDRSTGEVLDTVERALDAGLVVPLDAAPVNAPDARRIRLRVARNLAESLILELFDPLAYETGSSRTFESAEGE